MIVAVSFGPTNGDTPSVYIVDTLVCTPVWRRAILAQLEPTAGQVEMPDEWVSLQDARVPLPARVEAACHVFYRD